VSGWIHVVPDDLRVSAAKVDVHADELHLRHTAANGLIEAAWVGVPAGSAAALSAAVAKWRTDTTLLFGNLVDHGEALRGAAAGYESTDQHNAEGIDAVGDQARAFGLGR
jgi:hypothetical protein